jgi:hypothetical protein
MNLIQYICIFFFFFAILGFELMASHLLDSHSTPWATLPALFVLDIFEIGSQELFAQAGFKLQSF